MSVREYRASLSRSQGRNAWSLIFRHPLLYDKDNQPGLRIRRGLGTTDEKEAQKMVDQLNTILSNRDLWVPTARENLERTNQYDPRVISAFYDNLVFTPTNRWALREQLLPLPKDSKRILLVGTTGAGKTTLVRQLIGTDPKKERFPSTSTARTTIADTEIVLQNTLEYSAVVTFLTEDEVRLLIEECVVAATLVAFESGKQSQTSEIARKLLEHTEQRFRLKYILGTLPSSSNQEDDEDDEDNEDLLILNEIEGVIPSTERQQNIIKLQLLIEEIRKLAEETREEISKILGDFSEANKADKEAFEELIETQSYEHALFHQIVESILKEVKTRFDMLPSGTLQREHGDWPSTWNYQSNNRADFLKTVNFFSSNYAFLFGRLLTPLVEGIRVAGPFKPEWQEHNMFPVVLLDGEGLGHTPSSSSSLPAKILERFEIADSIILVDNATMPMQAAPGAVLRNLVVTGFDSKLLIAITHFDQVKGDNLRTLSEKRDHVLGSLDNMIATVCEDIGKGAAASLRRELSERVLFLANIQKATPDLKESTRQELQKLLNLLLPSDDSTVNLNQSTKDIDQTKTKPIYDQTMLILYVQRAIQDFREIWRARLKLGYRNGIYSEHWGRIKALTRRIGILGLREYHDLRPASDLSLNLQTHIYMFLRSEVTFLDDPTIHEQAIRQIAREITPRLLKLSTGHLLQNEVLEWQSAFENYKGPGSTQGRAKHIDAIYSTEVPLLSEVPNPKLIPIVKEIQEVVRQAIDTYTDSTLPL